MKSRAVPAFPIEGLRFLRSLKSHNNRPWFQERKEIYEDAVKRPMQDLVEALAVDFGAFAPELVASPKTSIYRIYRDTRFAKDKSPYKTHIAAVFPRKGLDKHGGAGLYFHIDPKEVLIGGGVYMPEPEDLNAIRSHIAEKTRDFKKIIEGHRFRKLFGEISGEQLSRVPRGFPSDHPAAAYLRYRQYLAARTLKAEAAISPSFYETLVETFKAMMPLIRFLNDPLIRNRKVRERQDAVISDGHRDRWTRSS
jgi:uncharacterized protein (TIGR02453 family)